MLQPSSFDDTYWPRVSEAFICLHLFLLILVTAQLKILQGKLNEWNQDAKSLPRFLKIQVVGIQLGPRPVRFIFLNSNCSANRLLVYCLCFSLLSRSSERQREQQKDYSSDETQVCNYPEAVRLHRSITSSKKLLQNSSDSTLTKKFLSITAWNLLSWSPHISSKELGQQFCI